MTEGVFSIWTGKRIDSPAEVHLELLPVFDIHEVPVSPTGDNDTGRHRP